MAHLAPPLIQKFFDDDGNPLAGGKVWTYEAGTTTPLATYTDATESAENTNPVILDGNGEANIWFSDTEAYKIVVTDENDVVLKTVDNYVRIPDDSITKEKINSDIAGDGLSQDVNGSLTVNVDDSTLQIDSDTLQVKDGGIDTDQLADESVSTDKLASDLDLINKINNVVEVVFDKKFDFMGEKLVGIPQYKWEDPTYLSNPSSLPSGPSAGASWTPNSEYLAVTSQDDPFIVIYKREGSSFLKLDDPATLPIPSGETSPFGVSCDFSPCGNYLAVSVDANTFTPYDNIAVYKRVGDTFIKIDGMFNQSPSFIPHIKWSNSGRYVAAAVHAVTPLKIFKVEKNQVYLDGSLTGSTDGTIANVSAPNLPDNQEASIEAGLGTMASAINLQLKELQEKLNDPINWQLGFTTLSDPSTLPTGDAYCVAWSHDDRFLAVTHETSPYLTVYERNEDTFTKLTDPATLPADIGRGLCWSPDGVHLAVGSEASPFLSIYKRSGTTLTKLADLSDLPSDIVTKIDFSPNGRYMAVAFVASPYLYVYERDGDTFTKLTDPDDAPGSIPISVRFSKNSRFLAVGVSNSPYIMVYETTYSMPTNAILYMRNINDV